MLIISATFRHDMNIILIAHTEYNVRFIIKKVWKPYVKILLAICTVSLDHKGIIFFSVENKQKQNSQ